MATQVGKELHGFLKLLENQTPMKAINRGFDAASLTGGYAVDVVSGKIRAMREDDPIQDCHYTEVDEARTILISVINENTFYSNKQFSDHFKEFQSIECKIRNFGRVRRIVLSMIDALEKDLPEGPLEQKPSKNQGGQPQITKALERTPDFDDQIGTFHEKETKDSPSDPLEQKPWGELGIPPGLQGALRAYLTGLDSYSPEPKKPYHDNPGGLRRKVRDLIQRAEKKGFPPLANRWPVVCQNEIRFTGKVPNPKKGRKPRET